MTTNPNGRKGGEPHQKLTQDVSDDIQKKGLFSKLEQIIELITGRKRFIDVAGIDKNSKKFVELHQIGRINKNGTPVKRERVVMQEVFEETGIEIQFHAYNEMENNDDEV